MSSVFSLVSTEQSAKKKPRKTSKPTAPVTVEGFQATNRSLRSWTGPSIIFRPSMHDIFYQNYYASNLAPNPDLVSLVNSMDVAPPDIPSYGSQLSNFDAGSISSIPWDADNASSLQTDIVWGHVTSDASKSIYMKVYHQNLFSDPSNFPVEGAQIKYHSQMLNVSATSAGDAAMLQIADAIGTVAGQMALNAASSKLDQVYKAGLSTQIIAGLEKARLARIQRLNDLRLPIANDAILSKIDKQIDSVKSAVSEVEAIEQRTRVQTINDKISAGTALTDAEKLDKAAYDAKNASKSSRIPLDKPAVKTQLRLGIGSKLKAGLRRAGQLAIRLKSIMNGILTRFLTQFITKSVAKRGIIWGMLSLMNGSACAAAVATLGVLAPLCAAVSLLSAAYAALDSVCMVLEIVLMILLPALLDKALANGGVCPDGGKPLDQVISDDFLYFLFSTFVPIGGVLDAFGPYLCYKSDASIVMKKPLYIPPHFADSSLSLYKHVYPPAQEPRGEETKYSDPAQSVPPGWKITAGIAREPCVAGTWTSSDVDMLCNISTYVPRTYAKGSKIPKTVPKGSKIPATVPKDSFITTRYRDSVRTVRTPTYRACPAGTRDTSLGSNLPGDCWSDLKCDTKCWGDWDPSHWGCNTSCSGRGGIEPGHFAIQREECPAGYKLHLSLCRSECPTGATVNAETDLFCKGSCAADEDTWGELPFCTGKTDAYCVAKARSKGKSGTNWQVVAGVCWEKCAPGDVDVGALCRKGCGPGKNDVAGVCWDTCGPNTEDVGALCRDKCVDPTPHDVAGVCWGSCGNNIDVGALCRERCRSGFHEVAGVCWGDVGTYARGSRIPKSTKTYDAGYNPPETIAQLGIPYCDFSKPEMLDRMAQFYYDQSTLNPQQLDDGRISYEYIIQFYGVIASSELSCDVACQMKTVKFDPVTGGQYEESIGTNYPEDPGNEVSYRRFYFINIDAASAATLAARAATNPALYNKAWPADPAGLFTVTGCTNSDYTAPDAMSKSTDAGVDPLISVPKVFNVKDKRQGSVQFSLADFATSAASVVTMTGLGAAGGRSFAGQVAGSVAGGMAGQALSTAIGSAMNVQQPLGAAVENAVVGPVSGTVEGNNAVFSVATNNDNYNIDHGPIYEVRARDGTGYVPTISFCGKVNTTELLCSHQLILRDTINTYHKLNPNVHIKSVNEIEPRGKDGCYYKFNTVSYDAATNTEGTVTSVGEVIRKYVQTDQSTCAFSATNTFITDMTAYPVRSYYDPFSKTTKYPTRNVSSTATVQGRYIRVRPSQTGDGFLRLSQIAVYDSTGINLALKRPVYSSTATYAGYGPPNLIVDGTLACRSGIANVWAGSNNIQTGYIDIDLGMNYYISYVLFMGQLDIATPANDQGVRVEVLFTNEPTATPQMQLTTPDTGRVQKLDFTTQMILPKLPVTPFQVPRPLPDETNLGTNCPTRCQDKSQINDMVKSYNAANTASQIIKVTKAVTSTPTRCDYEVDMVRKGTSNTVGKEVIKMTATLATSGVDASAVVYGRYVRILAGGTNPLLISQIVVKNAAGTNIALRKATYSTSNNIRSSTPATSGPSALVTDGTLSQRPAPEYWASTTLANEFIAVDLGASSDIASIIVYGVVGGSYTDVKVQIVNYLDLDATPIYSTTLPTGQTTYTISQFNKCTFTYTQLDSPYSYIQDTTPSLASVDTSGGVLSFQSITNSIMNLYNSVINPLKATDPVGKLSSDINSANTAVSNIVGAAVSSLELQGCPTTKCSDPAILTAIANRYAIDNSSPTTQYGGETNTMAQIVKAGISGPNTCDILFTNTYNLFDDYLYPPTLTKNTTTVKRFMMTNMGNCALQVSPGRTSIIDVSMNAVGIIPASANLASPFTVKPCQVNCRDPALLASVKTKLNSIIPDPNAIPNFTSVNESFANGTSTCEYFMKKDMTNKNPVTRAISTEANLDTYITATFTTNSATCSFTLDTVKEIDPELITTTSTGDYLLNGRPVSLPYLFNYDPTTPSPRVNATRTVL